MVAWLILYHGLWERSSRDGPAWREAIAVFNASTVFTLIIGLTCAYLLLVALSSGAAAALIESTVLGDTLRRPVCARLREAHVLATSCATFAGALGAGSGSEQAVREAACSDGHRNGAGSSSSKQQTTTPETCRCGIDCWPVSCASG